MVAERRRESAHVVENTIWQQHIQSINSKADYPK